MDLSQPLIRPSKLAACLALARRLEILNRA